MEKFLLIQKNVPGAVDAFIPANRKNCREAAICWQ